MTNLSINAAKYDTHQLSKNNKNKERISGSDGNLDSTELQSLVLKYFSVKHKLEFHEEASKKLFCNCFKHALSIPKDLPVPVNAVQLLLNELLDPTKKSEQKNKFNFALSQVCKNIFDDMTVGQDFKSFFLLQRQISE